MGRVAIYCEYGRHLYCLRVEGRECDVCLLEMLLAERYADDSDAEQQSEGDVCQFIQMMLSMVFKSMNDGGDCLLLVVLMAVNQRDIPYAFE